MVRTGARLLAQGQAAAPTLVVAAALLLGLQAIRVFATHTVWVIGETSSRQVLGLVVLGGFAATILAWPLARAVGLGQARAWSLRLLAGGAVIGQISTAPWVDFAAGLAGTIGLGWFVALLLPSLGSAARIGLALAFLLDIVVRVSLITVDAPFAREPAAAAVVAVAVAIVALGIPWVATLAARLPGWRNAWSLIGLGPGLAIYMLLSGNIGQVIVGADIDFRAAALVLVGSAALGVLWTQARRGLGGQAWLVGLAAGLLFIAGFALFEAGTLVAALGSAAMAATMPVVLAALVPFRGDSKRAGASATFAMVGLVTFIVLLFVFYSFYGPDWVLRAAVAAAIASLAVAGVIREPSARAKVPGILRSLAAPSAFAVLAVLPAAVVAITAATPAKDSRASPDGLTVITYNIRQGFGTEGRFDLEAVAQTLEDNPADVIALQEVGRGWVISGAIDTLAWLSQRLDMPYVYGANAADLWGNAVLSRLPIRGLNNYHFDDPGRVPRGVLEVEVNAGEQTYTILNTHLDHEDDGGPTREQQIEVILEVWSGRSHTLVVGDLNATSDEPPMQRLSANRFEDPDTGGPPTSPDDGQRIDYVLHTPDLVAVEVRRPITGASDHEPVWVRLTSQTVTAR